MTNPVMADIRPDRNRPMVSDRHRTGRDLGSVGPVDPALGAGRRRRIGSDDGVRRPDTSGGSFARSSALRVVPGWPMASPQAKACTISGYVQGLLDGIEFKPGGTIAAHPATAPGTPATK